MKVLLSIKPEYVEKIFNGEKKYEYRKVIFKKNVDTIVVYSTMPEGLIVGEFKVDTILFDSPELIWNETKKFAGVSAKFFKEYFANRHEGYAIKIIDPVRYEKPIDPKLEFDSFYAPQSFCYIT
ncbi:ASCH domain-containing protein [Paenibacillus typhae]|uniref:Predicted transcriptional regulator, contains an HTH and PUA-like domains n=1 Tax=Paenibacillus typhae TaxID=1174501 RepID=A0A1G8FB44_9BACL|nr:ASCH domain-containing protein [Paenibacillus typhae]SDH79315.1 Predicted transcriptional regulator, contains an HTH and PUA-like domains [Paenibacillus typhae]